MISVRNLDLNYRDFRAVKSVSFSVPDGPFGVGLVGESGSGKTTIMQALLGLMKPAGGTMELDGNDIPAMLRRDPRAYRRAVQAVLQDVDGTLNPRMKVGSAIAEVLRFHEIVPKVGVSRRVDRLLDEVGLDPALRSRLPHQLSGGQRQRVAIARALALEPQVLLLDEPTSALDVAVQERILQLIETIRDTHHMSYLLISHNLAVVQRLCERTVVLYSGHVVEAGPTRQILWRPLHPYTAMLRSAVPEILRAADGTILPPVRVKTAHSTRRSTGCPFAPRCSLAIDQCWTVNPEPREVAPGTTVACHRAEDVHDGEINPYSPPPVEQQT